MRDVGRRKLGALIAAATVQNMGRILKMQRQSAAAHELFNEVILVPRGTDPEHAGPGRSAREAGRRSTDIGLRGSRIV